MFVLIQFLFRLAFGLTLGMALTSPSQVTAGFYRVHSYVALGFLTLASLVALAVPDFAIGPPVLGAILCYIAAVLWLYEVPRPGRLALLLIALVSLLGAWQTMLFTKGTETLPSQLLRWLDPVVGGLVLGTTLAAMLLGHWYLNTPTMQLAPLRRLILIAAGATLLRAMLAAVALALALSSSSEELPTSMALFLTLRWLSGLLGAIALYWMTWQTLKVPNTQSATGILYVAVIATFLGELTAQLLSGSMGYPV